jgi:catechol-2,3-dioxygenase
MIQARRLAHIVLSVRDAARSRDFYTRTLGLKVAHEDLAHGTVFQLATGTAPEPSQPGLHHMAWQLGSFEELRAAYRELKAIGVPVESTIEHNVTRSVYFHDPDGNRVELFCDMVENGFEAMQTLGPRRAPLDLDRDPAVSGGPHAG